MKLVGTEKLTESEVETLSAVLDTLIPASTALGMPSAGEPRIVEDVHHSVRNTQPILKSTLAKINDSALEQHTVRFSALTFEQRTELLNSDGVTGIPEFRTLQFVLLQCYYRDPVAMKSLGMEPRAPFPEGFDMEQGDWDLLEPVKRRSKFYREV